MRYHRARIPGASYFFTVNLARRKTYLLTERISKSRANQRRARHLAAPLPSTGSGQVWEHVIRDDDDYRRHVDYIHFNPVKHGFVRRPADWKFSSIHRYIREKLLPPDWACFDDSDLSVFGER